MMAGRGERQSGYKALERGILTFMGNRRLDKIECLNMLETQESKRLKVTALNLFHPTASSPLLLGSLSAGRGEGEGEKHDV